MHREIRLLRFTLWYTCTASLAVSSSTQNIDGTETSSISNAKVHFRWLCTINNGVDSWNYSVLAFPSLVPAPMMLTHYHTALLLASVLFAYVGAIDSCMLRPIFLTIYCFSSRLPQARQLLPLWSLWETGSIRDVSQTMSQSGHFPTA